MESKNTLYEMVLVVNRPKSGLYVMVWVSFGQYSGLYELFLLSLGQTVNVYTRIFSYIRATHMLETIQQEAG